MTKKFLIALTSAAFISTSASAGGLISPVQEPTVIELPDFDDAGGSLMLGSGPSTRGLLLGTLGLLALGAIVSGGGS